MKKKSIAFILIAFVITIISVILFTPVFDLLKNIDFLQPYMDNLNNILYRDGKFYESIFGAIVLIFNLLFFIFALSFFFVKKVDDTTMPSIPVEQKIVAVDYNKNDPTPSMVIVHESKIEDGGNNNEKI